jgi:curved DNA-binding protein CbpA
LPDPIDNYEILQVSRNAEPEVIEAAYRRFARMYHPDVDKSPGANERMAQINRAYGILRDPEKRAEYDRSRGWSNVSASSAQRAEREAQAHRADGNGIGPTSAQKRWCFGLLIGAVTVAVVIGIANGGGGGSTTTVNTNNASSSARTYITATPQPRATATPRPRATATPRPRATATLSLAQDIQAAKSYLQMGYNYGEQGDYQKEIEQYDEAIRLDPQFVNAYYNRGVAYGYLGQYEREIQDYDEAIRLNPQFAKAYNNRGLAYTDLGQYERAIQDYDKAIRLDPQVANSYNNRGVAYGYLGQYERAIQDYDEVIRLDPQFALAYYNRGFTYQDISKSEEAARDFAKAKELGYDP